MSETAAWDTQEAGLLAYIGAYPVTGGLGGGGGVSGLIVLEGEYWC